MQRREHKPRSADEEILGTKRRTAKQQLTEDERLERIEGEMRRAFVALKELGPAVTMFGSARTPEGHPVYGQSREVARLLGEAGFAIITGGGPGVMEAGNRGAQEAGVTSVGLSIELPFEQYPNPFQDIELNFHYFFTRKLMFVRYATAYVVMPGGYGTLDELFEALVLEQTDKIHDFPIVLFGSEYWRGLVDWLHDKVVGGQMMGAADLALVRVTDDPAEVVEIICRARDRVEPQAA
jgi:uncharacterized protein (TIGR00730 family)